MKISGKQWFVKHEQVMTQDSHIRIYKKNPLLLLFPFNFSLHTETIMLSVFIFICSFIIQIYQDRMLSIKVIRWNIIISWSIFSSFKKNLNQFSRLNSSQYILPKKLHFYTLTQVMLKSKLILLYFLSDMI